MKYAAFGLMCLAAPLQAQDLCGLDNATWVLERIEGDWEVAGGLSFEAQGDAMIERIVGNVRIGPSGMFTFEMEGQQGDVFFLRANNRPYDAEKLSEFFARVDASWIRNAATPMPCAMDQLMQLRATSDNPNGDFNQVTILPYLENEAVMIAEIETLQEDVGLAFVTIVGLMTRP